MRLRGTFGLLCLLCALVAAYVGVQRWQAGRVKEAEAAKKLFAFAPGAVHSLTIAQLNQPAVTAVREADEPWKITAPNATIQPLQLLWTRVAAHLAGLMNERTLMGQVAAPKDFGLDPPALVVEAQAEGAGPVRIEFGDVEATQRFRYARLNGGMLFLVATNEYFELNRSLMDLRHRFVVEDRDANILELQFAWIWHDDGKLPTGENAPKAGEESVVITVKRDDPKSPWKMTTPVESPANQEAVDEIVKEIQFATASSFVDTPENLSDYGLKPALARITVVDDRSGRAQNILIGSLESKGEKGGLFVQRAGQDSVYVIDGMLVTLFPKTPLKWRETRIVTRRVSDLKRIEYRAKGDAFVLAKDAGGAWTMESPKFEAVSPFAVSGYLAVLKETGGNDLLEGPLDQYGLDKPDVTITLNYDDGGAAEIRVVKDTTQADLYYATQDTGGIVALRGVAAKALLTESEVFRSRELMRFDKAKAVRLELQFDNLGMVLEKQHDQWIVARPDTITLNNQSDVEAILGAVCPLYATRTETPGASTGGDYMMQYGLDKPIFTLIVTLADGDGAPETTVGPVKIGLPAADNPQERYALSEGRPGFFRVKQQVIETIREALRGFARTPGAPEAK